MGSRAVVVLCREESVSQWRFGVTSPSRFWIMSVSFERTYCCHSDRSGRDFYGSRRATFVNPRPWAVDRCTPFAAGGPNRSLRSTGPPIFSREPCPTRQSFRNPSGSPSGNNSPAAAFRPGSWCRYQTTDRPEQCSLGDPNEATGPRVQDPSRGIFD
jgi:hypothetical protein